MRLRREVRFGRILVKLPPPYWRAGRGLSWQTMKTGIVAVALVACLAACDGAPPPVACAAYATAGLGVAVIDADTNQPICDATVTATDGSYEERLIAVSCTFTGAYERPGTYVIQASRDGFLPNEVASVRVVMDTAECPHVQETRITVPLTPQK